MSSTSLGTGDLRRLLDAGRLLVSETDFESVLESVLEDAKEITGARYAALGVLDAEGQGLDRFITSGIDAETHARIGDLPTGQGVLGVLITEPQPLRLDKVSEHPQSFGFPDHHPPMGSFLGVPILIRGQVFGNLYLTEKADDAAFSETDEAAAMVLADWAALAIDRTRSEAQDRLRESVAGSERERRRWSRELHDETLQGMGAIRVLLATGMRQGAGPELERFVADAIAQLGEEIDRLRGLITDLRPAALDELGLGPAIEEVARRAELRDHTRISTAIALAHELGIEDTRLDPELESAIYRIVQESLRNAGRHARAATVSVNIVERDDTLVVTIEDDGLGFDTSKSASGFGLRGLRERTQLRGGTLEIESQPGAGTTLTASLPVVRTAPISS